LIWCKIVIFVISSYWFCCCDGSKIEGSQATAKQTAELLRSVISHQRVSHTNQATSLINAIRTVGEKIIDANPIGIYISSFHTFLFYNRNIHIMVCVNVNWYLFSMWVGVWSWSSCIWKNICWER